MFFDLSEKIDKKMVEALRTVKDAAEPLGISFFVVGASARDIILQQCYGIEPQRRTIDIDLGVEVESWEMFDRLMNVLVSTGKFSTTKEKQRLKFGSQLIDFIPFGGITDNQHRISWPPEHTIFMNILGFKDAYENAIIVRMSSTPILEIKIPSLPGLALMKLIAWREKYPERNKDAQDLLFIMKKYEYEDTGIFDKLYSDEPDLLQTEGFDTRLASVRLLGRHMALITDKDTAREVMDILNEETESGAESKLAIAMLRNHGFDQSEGYEEMKRLIEKLKEGFAEYRVMPDPGRDRFPGSGRSNIHLK
jgi:predicted nucleotidyltransferase